MSVLQREADAYQRAMDLYQIQANAYNASLVRDSGNNPIVRDKKTGTLYAVGQDGKLTMIDPSGVQYAGATALPDDKRFELLRRNPLPDGTFATRPEFDKTAVTGTAGQVKRAQQGENPTLRSERGMDPEVIEGRGVRQGMPTAAEVQRKTPVAYVQPQTPSEGTGGASVDPNPAWTAMTDAEKAAY